jgi:hypothetical protein
MEARPSLLLRVNQAVPDETRPDVVLHELASRNWFLPPQLEAWENPIGRLRVRRLAMPFLQQLGHPETDALVFLVVRDGAALIIPETALSSLSQPFLLRMPKVQPGVSIRQ